MNDRLAFLATGLRSRSNGKFDDDELDDIVKWFSDLIDDAIAAGEQLGELRGTAHALKHVAEALGEPSE